MFNAAFAELGLRDWHYQRLPAPPDMLDGIIRGLPGGGFEGANVTMPHKAAALAIADSATPAARAIGAANTLTFAADGTIDADNTDAPGLIAALGGAGVSVAGRTALVVGAGGSARAIVWALREAGATDVAVWNRTPERAGELAEAFGVRPVTTLGPADVLVHCTSIGLDGADAAAVLGLPPLGTYGTVVDFVYTPSGTALLSAAAAAGCTTVDGREILVRQGAVGFERWTGRPAPLDVMRAAVGAE